MSGEKPEDFGFDLTNPEDVIKWKATEPKEEDMTEPHDYSRDAFEFGGIDTTLDKTA